MNKRTPSCFSYLKEYEEQQATHILETLNQNPRAFYRFFKGSKIDNLVEAIQLADEIRIPLTTNSLTCLMLSGRYEFNGRYYLIH